MKWLAALLTFVNVTTVSGLLLGITGPGIGRGNATYSLSIGLAAAILAWFGTMARGESAVADLVGQTTAQRGDEQEQPGIEGEIRRAWRRYRFFWVWFVSICFALFAFRSFCWLFYTEGGDFKIQSPNNLGDIALHLTLIKNFASGVALWPESPIYSFGYLRYPAGIDLFNAILTVFGIDLRHGLVWTGLIASAATCFAFYRWGGVFGIAGFLFNGGLAGFQVCRTLQMLDYQGAQNISWKSIPLAMFVTQRGLLYAIPAGLLLLCHWRSKFFPVAAPKDFGAERGGTGVSDPGYKDGGPLPFWVEFLLYATIALFHFHTFLALSVVAACFFVFGNTGMRKHFLGLVAASFLPATFFVWLITDHFHASSILEWNPGWTQRTGEFQAPVMQFWFVNFGLWIPLVLCWLGFFVWRLWQASRTPVEKESGSRFDWRRLRATLSSYEAVPFAIPALIVFLLTVLVKAAPWEWDNIKLLIWAYFIILPFLWSDLISKWELPIRVGVCIALFASGFVSLFGGLAASKEGLVLADRFEYDVIGTALKTKKISPEARFASFPTYNHPLLLHGRKVALGYPGHLWTEGFDYADAMTSLNALMEGAPDWRANASKLRVRYLFWGNEEKINYPMSTQPWVQESRLIFSHEYGAIYDLEQPPLPPNESGS